MITRNSSRKSSEGSLSAPDFNLETSLDNKMCILDKNRFIISKFLNNKLFKSFNTKGFKAKKAKRSRKRPKIEIFLDQEPSVLFKDYETPDLHLMPVQSITDEINCILKNTEEPGLSKEISDFTDEVVPDIMENQTDFASSTMNNNNPSECDFFEEKTEIAIKCDDEVSTEKMQIVDFSRMITQDHSYSSNQTPTHETESETSSCEVIDLTQSNDSCDSIKEFENVFKEFELPKMSLLSDFFGNKRNAVIPKRKLKILSDLTLSRSCFLNNGQFLPPKSELNESKIDVQFSEPREEINSSQNDVPFSQSTESELNESQNDVQFPQPKEWGINSSQNDVQFLEPQEGEINSSQNDVQFPRPKEWGINSSQNDVQFLEPREGEINSSQNDVHYSETTESEASGTPNDVWFLEPKERIDSSQNDVQFREPKEWGINSSQNDVQFLEPREGEINSSQNDVQFLEPREGEINSSQNDVQFLEPREGEINSSQNDVHFSETTESEASETQNDVWFPEPNERIDSSQNEVQFPEPREGETNSSQNNVRFSQSCECVINRSCGDVHLLYKKYAAVCKELQTVKNQMESVHAELHDKSKKIEQLERSDKERHLLIRNLISKKKLKKHKKHKKCKSKEKSKENSKREKKIKKH